VRGVSPVGQTTLRLATWNIGGGRIRGPHRHRQMSEIDYFADVLLSVEPSIVCLQESHNYRDPAVRDQSSVLAELLGMRVVASQQLSVSHVDEGAWLTSSVLTALPATGQQYTQFPNPRLSGHGPTGERWESHDKGVLVVNIAVQHESWVRVVNAHCFPLHYFGADARDPGFDPIWSLLKDVLRGSPGRSPTLAALDLNYEPIGAVLGDPLPELGLRSAFSQTATTPKGKQQDYILHSRDFQLMKTSVIPTRADHHLCVVEVAYAGRHA